MTNTFEGMSAQTKRTLAYVAAAVMVLLFMVMPDIAWAGDEGAEFDEIWELLEGWVQGTLGRIISLIMIIVGVVYGIRQQNIMAFVMGPAAGIGLYYSPSIIQGLVGAGIAL
ncbi:hypothetical protein AQ621_16965 (plasmid) [Marinobacter sp. P4B1]|nr:hypothetical protein AQ621_16965 [Marinobacter sp. P4B1]